jgi:hypothetical protein
MKSSAFPIRVEVDVMTASGDWKLEVVYLVNSLKMLHVKMEEIKSRYVIQREYRIFFVLNSKVNNFRE